MNVQTTIKAIRDYCPSFNNRVYGCSEFARLDLESLNPGGLPSAYVFTLAEAPSEPQRSQNSYYQDIIATVAVVLLVDNSSDRRGQASTDNAEDLKSEIFKAILGWSPTSDKFQIYEYQNYSILRITPSVIAIQLEFQCVYTITELDTRQYVDLCDLSELTKMHADIDVIRDNTKAPDGHIEASFEVNNLNN